MTIKELEERLGMTRANIRFYEQEGLLAPARTPNGYRDYSEADVRTLEKIKLLRQLQFDLDTIRALQSGERSLTDALSDQLGQLDTDKAALEGSRSVCARLRDTAVSFEALDAGPWLRELGQLPDSPRFGAPKDELPPPPGHPFRRWFARGVDLGLCASLYKAFRQFVLHIPLPAQEEAIKFASFEEEFMADLDSLSILLPWNAFRDFLTLENLLSTFVPFLLLLLIEPILIHYWGTTPGKFLFGMKLRDSEGEKLSWSDAFHRTWGVLLWGKGFNIPYFSFWRIWRSYYIVVDMKDRNRWEYVHSTGQPEQYIIPDKKIYCIPYLLYFFAPLIWSCITSIGDTLPPNRYTEFPWQNLLSEEEFDENYQYYLNRYHSGQLDQLEEYPGEWTPIYTDPNTARVESAVKNEDGEWESVVTMDVTVPGAFQYTLRAPASLYRTSRYGDTCYPYQVATTAGLLAYAGAMPGENFVSFHPYDMMHTLFEQELNFDFTFQMSAEGSWGKWYENTGGSSIAVWDNRVHVSQQVVRESTGETVYRIFDIEDDDEWLLLTFTISNKIIRE